MPEQSDKSGQIGGVEKTIGGFFAPECAPTVPGVAPDCGVLDFWGVTETNAALFQNARSALRYIFNNHQHENRQAGRIWAPAFICADAIVAAPEGMSVDYFPIQPNLSPDVDWLNSRAMAGDCVLAVDYFGRPPALEFIELTRRRTDILWIEDRAQALSPSEVPWGDWVVYSPRKLFGVPDGGVALQINAQPDASLSDPGYTPEEETSAKTAPVLAPALKAAVKTQNNREAAFQEYRESEAAMTVGATTMSQLTRQLLCVIDPLAAITRRRENYAILDEALGDYAVFSNSDVSFAPLGFPVRHVDCDRILGHLHKEGVFAARHWRDLPSPASAFPWEHALAREIMTLPCDQRYDAKDMQRVAHVFLEAVR